MFQAQSSAASSVGCSGTEAAQSSTCGSRTDATTTRWSRATRGRAGSRVSVTAWEASSVNIPFIAHLKEGQKLEDYLKEHEKPNYAYFEHLELPKLLWPYTCCTSGSDRGLSTR